MEIPQSCELLEENECSPEYEYPPRQGPVQRGESTDGENRRVRFSLITVIISKLLKFTLSLNADEKWIFFFFFLLIW
jgi:hypothetical protein